jgi:hypothetical protein
VYFGVATECAKGARSIQLRSIAIATTAIRSIPCLGGPRSSRLASPLRLVIQRMSFGRVLCGISIDLTDKVKMQMIQFDSIVNLIQMKWMKVISNMRNMMTQEFQHFVDFDGLK